MWWRDVYYYYTENYVFRRLIMAVFRLYMIHLISSYTNIYIYIQTHIWSTYMGKEGGGKVGTRSRANFTPPSPYK